MNKSIKGYLSLLGILVMFLAMALSGSCMGKPGTVTTISTSTPTTYLTGTNLLGADGTFESNSPLNNWKDWKGKYTPTVVSDGANGTSHAVEMLFGGSETGMSYSTFFAASEGESYTLSGYLKVTGGEDSVLLGVRCCDSNEKRLNDVKDYKVKFSSNSSTWKKFSGTLTTVAGTACVEVYFYTDGTTSGGKGYVDEICLVKN